MLNLKDKIAVVSGCGSMGSGFGNGRAISTLLARQGAKVFGTDINESEFINSLADGYWKRNIVKNSSEIIYINKPIVKFFLDGVSSSKPSKEFLISILMNKKIHLLRKFTFLSVTQKILMGFIFFLL